MEQQNNNRSTLNKMNQNNNNRSTLNAQRSTKNPWFWIPTLYIAEGLPNVLVISVAVVMYMQLGMSDTEIALYTSWLGLPWVIKPFWSPFVDLYTKMGTSLLQQSYHRTNVGMLVLQYGGNAMPGMSGKAGVDYYAKEVGRQIRYLKSIYPDTPILFIGPADMATKVDGELRSYPDRKSTR